MCLHCIVLFFSKMNQGELQEYNNVIQQITIIICI